MNAQPNPDFAQSSYLFNQQNLGDIPENKALNDNQENSNDTLPNLPNFPAVLNKADLVYEGNLEEMMYLWSDEERACSRRLVQFWRRHENNTIYCRFKSITPPEKSANSIIISCIYWREKEQCFITSVDCIYLLEALISVRFTVEEKNRIRRNLEGFRPLTVAKCKPETAEFFKLIMAFPSPKPRNIEKDVKVFPWKILSFALKKIAAGFTPALSLNANSAYSGHNSALNSGLASPASFTANFGGTMQSGFPGRANMQRRFSQPINSLTMAQQLNFVQNGGAGYNGPSFNDFQGNTGNSLGFNLLEEDETEFEEANKQSNPAFNFSTQQTPSENGSLSALNLENNFQNHMGLMPFQERMNTNFDHDFLMPPGMNPVFNPALRHNINPRRHSLADPYSLQRFQALKFGIGPLAMQGGNDNQNFAFNNNQGLTPITEMNYPVKQDDFTLLDGHNSQMSLLDPNNSSNNVMSRSNSNGAPFMNGMDTTQGLFNQNNLMQNNTGAFINPNQPNFQNGFDPNMTTASFTHPTTMSASNSFDGNSTFAYSN